MEPSKENAGPGAELPKEREDVRVATNRCPFCHDDVSVDQDAFVSCRSCQARHHSACWNEGGACGSCGHERCLADAPSEATKSKAPPQARGDLGRWGLGVGIAVAALGALGTLLSYQPETPTIDIPFGPRFEVGEPGLNAVGMLVVALVTLPLSLVGAGLGLGGMRRNPRGVGRVALAVNALYFFGMLVLAASSF